MYGLTLLSLCLVAAVIAQPGTYEGRRAVVPAVVPPVAPAIIGGIDSHLIRPGHIGGGVVGADCYRNEVPSYDRFGNIDLCSYRNRYCTDPRAVCRMTRGTTGTCCRPRGGIMGGNCRDRTQGLGSCYTDSECYRFGRTYECQFAFGLGGRGVCCSRSNTGIRY